MQLITEIQQLPARMENLMSAENRAQFKVIAEELKGQHNLFILAKGSGFYPANYMA